MKETLPDVERRGAAPNAGANRVWWLNPRIPVLFLGIPSLIVAFLVPQSTYILLYRTAKTIDFNFVVVGLIVYLGFLAGSFFTVSTGKGSQRTDLLMYCRFFVWPLFLLTLFAYLVWFVSATLRAGGPGPLLSVILQLLSSPPAGLADYVKTTLFDTIPGITTLTQLGVLYVTVEALLWVNHASPRRIALRRFCVIAVLTLARVVFHSERLSLLELIIPVAVVFVGYAGLGAKGRRFVHLFPAFGLIALAVLFSISEYFRSWSYYKNLYPGPYLDFALQRLIGYYTTANNNGAIYYYYLPDRPLRFTLNSLFRFPVLGGYFDRLYVEIFGNAEPIYSFPYTYILQTYGNPEFNNVSLVGLLPGDVSLWLAPVAAFVLGMMAASLHRSFVSGRLVGALLYPSWFIGVLEIPRIYYWADQRYFPVLAFVLLSLILFKKLKLPVKSPALVAHVPGEGASSGPPSPGTGEKDSVVRGSAR